MIKLVTNFHRPNFQYTRKIRIILWFSFWVCYSCSIVNHNFRSRLQSAEWRVATSIGWGARRAEGKQCLNVLFTIFFIYRIRRFILSSKPEEFPHTDFMYRFCGIFTKPAAAEFSTRITILKDWRCSMLLDYGVCMGTSCCKYSV